MNEWEEEKPILDAAREQRRIYFIPDHELAYEEINEQLVRKIGDRKSLSDTLQSHQTSQPERFKLGGTLCK